MATREYFADWYTYDGKGELDRYEVSLRQRFGKGKLLMNHTRTDETTISLGMLEIDKPYRVWVGAVDKDANLLAQKVSQFRVKEDNPKDKNDDTEYLGDLELVNR